MQKLWESFLIETTIADLLEGVDNSDLIDRIVGRVRIDALR